MKDFARQENGAVVVMTSCEDDAFPADNVLDGKESSFWITTGMFPQEFVISLAKPVQVSQIVVLSLNGKPHAAKRSQSRAHKSFMASYGRRRATMHHAVTNMHVCVPTVAHGGGDPCHHACANASRS
mmetsp:Transcript_6229/g.19255  ORF Transcript_6229/g.19255 Transcript_6229/m.19255 type:complete len:127 (-) Transcript_6229:557-937(-)